MVVGAFSQQTTTTVGTKGAFGLRRVSSSRLWSSVKKSSETTDSPGRSLDDEVMAANPLANGRTSGGRKEQLWLDLRGTALYPKEALHFLGSQLFEDDETDGDAMASVLGLVDAILVDEDGFQRIVSKNEREVAELQIYYTTESGDLIATDAAAQQSVPVGRILETSSKADELLDPLVALEASTNGEWLLLDIDRATFEQVGETKVQEQVARLMSFIAAAGSMSPSSASGLLVPTLPPDCRSRDSTCIGVTCPTMASLVNMNAALMSEAELTTKTDSGILLPTGMSGNQRSVSARIVPFDILIWKLALEWKAI